METGNLSVQIRTGKSSGENRRLRVDGFLPAVIYGKNIDPISVSMKKSEFKSSLSKYGRNAVYIVKLSETQEYPVIVKDIQHDPVKEDYVHVDLQNISLTDKIKVDIPVRIHGREALEADSLLIIQQLDFINVSCLPGQGPSAFEIDASKLTAGDSFTVGDLEIPEGIDIETEATHVVFSVNEARELDLEEETEDEAAEPELVGEEEKEEE